jgi:hypothetical protein
MTTPADLKPGIRWWRLIGGGFFIELALTAVAIVFYSTGQEQLLTMVVPPATLVVAVVFGAWAARGTASPLLNGTLAGVASFVIYGLLLLGNVLFAPQQPDLTLSLSPSYLASHVFKVLGAAGGGWWVVRSRGAQAA